MKGKVGSGTDDTALNGLEMMYCNLKDWDNNQESVLNERGDHGGWGDFVMCEKDQFIYTAQI